MAALSSGGPAAVAMVAGAGGNAPSAAAEPVAESRRLRKRKRNQTMVKA